MPKSTTRSPTAPRPTLSNAKWELAKGFKTSYQAYLKTNPEIKKSMTEFDRCKRLNPPIQLPGKMAEHKLDGPLGGVYDCHLSDDIILLYEPLGNGVYRLLEVCNHADLKGPRMKVLARRIK
jgi:mRNA-degrading endonuclease YafQ of YafQ-DinJ toxin-antitoxin module